MARSGLPTFIYIGAALICAQAALLVTRAGTTVPKPLVAVLALAGGAIMLSIASEQLFLGWLFLAPILQESAGTQRVGALLGLALYTAPPAILAVKTMLSRGPRPAARWFDAMPVVFVIYLAGSVILFSEELRLDFIGTTRGFYQTVGLGAIVYLIVVFWPGKAASATRVCGVVLAAAALQAAMAIGELATGWNLWSDFGWRREVFVQRSIATLANPALLGAFLGVGIVVALAVLSWEGPRQLRRLAWIMLLLGSPGLVFTYTRGPILATLLVAIPVLLLSKKTAVGRARSIALAGLAIFIAWPRITSSEVYQSRVSQRENVEIRVVLQDVSLKLAAEKPLFGWGYGSFDRVKYGVRLDNPRIPLAAALQDTSHNTFLTILVEYGGLGTLLFFLPFLAIGKRALTRVRGHDPDRWLYVASLGAIATVMLSAATFDLRFFSFIPMLPWLFLALIRRADADATETPAGR